MTDGPFYDLTRGVEHAHLKAEIRALEETVTIQAITIERLKAELADVEDGYNALREEKFAEVSANTKEAMEEIVAKLGTREVDRLKAENALLRQELRDHCGDC